MRGRTLDSAMSPPREVIKAALLMNAAAVVLAHVHRSGDPETSSEDCLIAGRIAAAGKIMRVQVCDPLVIGHGRFCSMRQSVRWPV